MLYTLRHIHAHYGDVHMTKLKLLGQEIQHMASTLSLLPSSPAHNMVVHD